MGSDQDRLLHIEEQLDELIKLIKEEIELRKEYEDNICDRMAKVEDTLEID